MSRVHVRFMNGDKVLDRVTLNGWEFGTREAAENWIRVVSESRYPQATGAVVVSNGKKLFSFNISL